MTDEYFLIQIEEYAKKLQANENSSENENSVTYEDIELEIDNLHQVIDSLKEQLYAEKEKVKILNEAISNKDKIIEYLKENKCEEKAEEGQKETVAQIDANFDFKFFVGILNGTLGEPGIKPICDDYADYSGQII